MSNERFSTLIQSFCSLTNLDDPFRLVHGGPIAINNIIFALIYKETNNADRFFIYCDFGEIPEQHKAAVCQQLLARNLYLYPDEGPTFALSAETGRVLLISHYALNDMDAETLYKELHDISAQVHLWRENYFLDEDTTSEADHTPFGLRL